MVDFTKNVHVVHTGLYSAKAKEVMNSVFGQLSDGWGENNPRNDMWWKFGDVQEAPDGEAVIVISNMSGDADYHGKWIKNNFYMMDDKAIKSWMARMIKKTMTMELKDDGCASGWKRSNENFKTSYLGNGSDISVAEVYCIYELLLDREVGVTKYEAHVMASVQGLKRTPDMVEIEIAKRKRMAELREANDKKVISLNEEEKAKIETLKQQIKLVEEEYRCKRQEAYGELHKQAIAEGLISKTSCI